MNPHALYRLALSTLLLLATPSGGQEPSPAHPAESEPHHHHPSHGYRHDFSDAERWSKRFDSEERREWQKPDEVIALMEIEPGMTAVDLGAGTGYFLGPLSAAVGENGRVVGLDVEESLVDFMNERAGREGWTNVEARRVPYDDPDLAEATVDRVLIVNTWHHIGDRGAYSAKLRRALKPGGRVYVVDLTKDSPSGPPPAHRLPPEQIIRELEAGGLRAETVEETLPRQFIVVGHLP